MDENAFYTFGAWNFYHGPDQETEGKLGRIKPEKIFLLISYDAEITEDSLKKQ